MHLLLMKCFIVYLNVISGRKYLQASDPGDLSARIAISSIMITTLTTTGKKRSRLVAAVAADEWAGN